MRIQQVGCRAWQTLADTHSGVIRDTFGLLATFSNQEFACGLLCTPGVNAESKHFQACQANLPL